MNTELETVHEPIELKKLSPTHKQVAALLAQGVDRRTIAVAVDFTPEYVTWLQRQPLFREYITHMSEAVAVRLEALFSRSVDVIQDAMQDGNIDEKLKGAKLQLEATGRVGRFQTQLPVGGGQDRLEQLSERLLTLLDTKRRTVYDNEGISDAEVVEQRRLPQPTEHSEAGQQV